MENDSLDLRRHIRAIKQGKWWFLGSLLFFITLAIVYNIKHMPQYDINASLLLEEESDGSGSLKKAGGMAQLMRTFSVGGFGSASIDNEIEIVKSHDVMLRTVKTLGLNRTYLEKDGLKKEILYKTSPVMMEAPDEFFDTLRTSFQVNVHLHRGGTADVTVNQGLLKKTVAEYGNITFPLSVKAPCGKFQLLKGPLYSDALNKHIVINVSGNAKMCEYFTSLIKIWQDNKKSDVISLSYADASVERGKDILNTIMRGYNDKRIERKNDKAQEEYDFYTNRINALMGELSDTEGRIESFKRSRDVNMPTIEASAYLQQSAKIQMMVDSARNEIRLLEMMLGSINSVKGSELIPTFEGMKDENITQYNKMVQERTELEKSAKPNNTVLVELNNKIAAAKKAVVRNVEKSISNAKHRADVISSHANQAMGRFEQMPGYEREYVNLMRDRELKNELYIFLLQKKESSLLNLTSNVTPSFVIDEAYSSTKPSKKKPMLVGIACLLLGLLLPLLWVLWRMRRKNTIQNAYDLPKEWEASAIELHPKKDVNNIKNVRAALLQHDYKRVLVAPFNHEARGLVNDLAATLNNIEQPCRVFAVNDTDQLLAGDIFNEINQAIDNGEYTLVELPVDCNLNEIADLLDSDNTMLVLALNKGVTKRKQFTQATQNIEPDNHIAII
ncbi:MAG: hypothetical protein J5523_03580 [Muribaculaceae bacterium]|nr:hypothetical protein [Muribaculaceae bacterium]